MEAQNDSIEVGGHRAWVEEPYAAMMHLEGDITEAHQVEFLALFDRIGQGKGPVVIVQDLSNAGTFTEGARAVLMQDERTARIIAVINIGASLQMQVALKTIGKVIGLVNATIAPMLFTDDEVGARRLLADERERLVKQSPAEKW